MALPASELHALWRKYALLGELRRRHDAQPPPELRPLAREFPGALRELDALPLDEIDRRSLSVELALRGGPTEALLEWVSQYHALMRAALMIKRRLRGRRQVSSEEASLLASSVSRELGMHCDLELVVAVQSPPRGRLNEVVFLRLASTFGVSPDRLRTALFRDVI
jgi:hypothetical protein